MKKHTIALFRIVSIRAMYAAVAFTGLTFVYAAKDPSCPQGIMQWQHGRYSKEPNGSLILTPFAVDGRQLVSDPCKGDQSSYTRYNQTEIFEVNARLSTA